MMTIISGETKECAKLESYFVLLIAQMSENLH